MSIKRLVVLLLVPVIMVFALSGCSSTLTSTLEPTAQRVTLNEASEIIEVDIPAPTYLPKDYAIQEIYVENSTVMLLISNKEIEKKLITQPGDDGVQQWYEFQCEMTMSIRWYSDGGVPVRLPANKVVINGDTGFLQDKRDHRTLWWNCYPDPDKPGMFELVLSANKWVSVDELVKTAESMGKVVK